MELREAVNEALQRLIASGRVKVQENGSWVASLENFQYELREKAGAVVLHLWSSESTLVRRVVGGSLSHPQYGNLSGGAE